MQETNVPTHDFRSSSSGPDEHISMILNSLNAHIAVLNAGGEIILVNEAWNKFGLENGAARGMAAEAILARPGCTTRRDRQRL